MRKILLLIVFVCLFALALFVAPVRRGEIPHYPPCDPATERMGRDGMCYSVS